jgi:hypothetical protein
MGPYLSTPNKEKHYYEAKNPQFEIVGAEMQGNFLLLAAIIRLAKHNGGRDYNLT